MTTIHTRQLQKHTKGILKYNMYKNTGTFENNNYVGYLILSIPHFTVQFPRFFICYYESTHNRVPLLVQIVEIVT